MPKNHALKPGWEGAVCQTQWRTGPTPHCCTEGNWKRSLYRDPATPPDFGRVQGHQDQVQHGIAHARVTTWVISLQA